MRSYTRAFPLCLVTGIMSLGLAAPAQADSIDDLRHEVAELRRTVAALQEQNVAPEAVQVTGRGAPVFSGEGFKDFKVRGRIQMDFGAVEGQSRFGDDGLGTTTEIRRVRLGAEGAFDDFSYVVEVDFADNGVSVEDAFLTWDLGEVGVVIGHHKPWVSFEEQSDDLLVPFMERAAFTTAFQFGYDLGVSVTHAGEDYSVKAGLLHAGDISGDDEAEGLISSLRVTYGPQVGDTSFLHLGGSVRHRSDISTSGQVEYSRRPQIHTTDTRFVDTGLLTVDSDTFVGLEAGLFSGPFYVNGEWGRLMAQSSIAGTPDAEFDGAYMGLGYAITGETIPYSASSGSYGRISPSSPIGNGGAGAFVAHARLDYLELNDSDAGVNGGEQTALMVGLTWIPHEHVRFLANYSYLMIDGGPFGSVANPGNPSDEEYSIDVLGIRAQVDW